MSKPKDKRRDLRFKTQFESLFSTERQEGVGTLVDISHSGAMMANASLSPAIGTKLRIYVFVQPVSPVEVIAQVVRVTDKGFAVEYADPGEQIRHLVDDAAAIVTVPKKRSS